MERSLAGSGSLPTTLSSHFSSSSGHPPMLVQQSPFPVQPGLLLYHYLVGGGVPFQPPLTCHLQQAPVQLATTPPVPGVAVSLPSMPFLPSSSSPPLQASPHQPTHGAPVAARTGSQVKEAATQTAGNEEETGEAIKQVPGRPTRLGIQVLFSLYAPCFNSSC